MRLLNCWGRKLNGDANDLSTSGGGGPAPAKLSDSTWIVAVCWKEHVCCLTMSPEELWTDLS